MASEASRTTLVGLTQVIVNVEPLNADAESDGLTRGLLEVDVATLLRETGIVVVTSQAPVGEVPFPTLHLDVMTVRLNARYAYSARLDLWQAVRLARDPAVVTSAVTWSGLQFVGTVARQSLADVRRAVQTAVGEFVRDWQGAAREGARHPAPPGAAVKVPPVDEGRPLVMRADRIRGRMVDIEVGPVPEAGWVAVGIVRQGLGHEKGLRFEARGLGAEDAEEHLRGEIEAYLA
jgi:hypothetical protein